MWFIQAKIAFGYLIFTLQDQNLVLIYCTSAHMYLLFGTHCSLCIPRSCNRFEMIKQYKYCSMNAKKKKKIVRDCVVLRTTRAFNAHTTMQLNITMCVLDYIIKHIQFMLYIKWKRERKMYANYSPYRGNFLISVLFHPIMASLIWAWTLCNHCIMCIQT